MGSVVKIFLHTLVMGAIGLAVVGCSKSPQQKIDEIAQDIQAELPKTLDDNTRLVKVYTKKLEIISEYELVNYVRTEKDSSLVEEQIKSYLKYQLCPSIKKDFLANGISSRYIYRSPDGEVILESLLVPGDC